MASKPTEMCVVEKSGAREYKVLLLLLFSFFFLRRLFLASVSFFHRLIACVAITRFSFSLSAVTRSGGSPSLVVDVWRWKGGGRTSRAVLFSRPVEFRRRRLFVSSQKLGAKRRAPLLETIGLMRKSVVDTTAPQNRAQFNRAARDARERVGTISARLSRGKWICPRESTATFEMRGRGWVVDDEASTKRHDQSRRSLFFPFFLSFLRKTRLLVARPF